MKKMVGRICWKLGNGWKYANLPTILVVGRSWRMNVAADFYRCIFRSVRSSGVNEGMSSRTR